MDSTVQAHSSRRDHDCNYHFNHRQAQDANLVFHQSSGDAIIFWQTSISTEAKATLCERIDLRISGQLEVPDTEDETAENISCGSETHAEQNGNLERHEVSKIEDRVQCPNCSRYLRFGETICG